MAHSTATTFEWGAKVARTNSSYESMRYNGVWYNLYDCVFCKSGMKNAFVGKLMRLFEDENGDKKVRLRWFFRPYELPMSVVETFSKEVKSSRELFIAKGDVKGVENVNVVDVILQKATVVCTARFGSNRIPSPEQLAHADHFFARAFDVKGKKLIAMTKFQSLQSALAKKFENKEEWLPSIPLGGSPCTSRSLEASNPCALKSVHALDSLGPSESTQSKQLELLGCGEGSSSTTMSIVGVRRTKRRESRATLFELTFLKEKKLKESQNGEAHQMQGKEIVEFIDLSNDERWLTL